LTSAVLDHADHPALRVRLGDPPLVAGMLARASALVSGHFQLLSGDHSDTFVRFSRIAVDQRDLDITAQWLLPSVAAWAPDVVIAPATAGVALAATLAARLAVPLALADVGDDGRPSHVRHTDVVSGRRTLLVNDVVTTGQGLAMLAQSAQRSGASIVGAAWFITRGDVAADDLLAAPVAAVADLPLPAWHADECPLCAHGEALTLAAEIN
jgi:orotate phosphoribosyltransferase